MAEDRGKTGLIAAGHRGKTALITAGRRRRTGPVFTRLRIDSVFAGCRRMTGLTTADPIIVERAALT
ncbi:hypothetical protein SAMN05216276_11295 [Streptosporangium subroseum]|uniref:Uncharacterized protein n=1 Tax=Streptosporangium subroseum TaxID=106412 RepID=A0A239PDG8_9ACTN|nr:hypothetical protein SAMN05216276_11295 [Streptosporangium subroseum]